MRMSELSRASGVAVPTIKFYQREGLLHPGEFSSPTQAKYDDSHVERLRLVRALIDVGGLSVSGAKAVIAAVDDRDLPLDWTFGVAQRAIPAAFAVAPTDPEAAAEPSSGETAIARILSELRLIVHLDNPGIPLAARVLDAYAQLGQDELLGVVPEYLQAALRVAEADLDAVERGRDRAGMAETVVIGTVLGDSLLAGLRRIAQEHVSHQRFPAPDGAARLTGDFA